MGMSIFTTIRHPRNRDRGRAGHPTQFAPLEKSEATHVPLSTEDVGTGDVGAGNSETQHLMVTVSPLTWERDDQLRAANDTNQIHLTVLSYSAIEEVRQAVASNPSCPEDTHGDLADDQSALVRGAIAQNPNLSTQIITKLTHDNETWVVRNSLRNPSANDETLARFVHHDNWMFRESCAMNTSLSEEQFQSLAADDDEAVILALISNPAAPGQVLRDVEKKSDQDDTFLLDRIRRHRNY